MHRSRRSRGHPRQGHPIIGTQGATDDAETDEEDEEVEDEVEDEDEEDDEGGGASLA